MPDSKKTWLAIPLGVVLGSLGLGWNVVTRQVDAVDKRVDTLQGTTKDRDVALGAALGVCVTRMEKHIDNAAIAQQAAGRTLERIETQLVEVNRKVTRMEPNAERMLRLELLVDRLLEEDP